VQHSHNPTSFQWHCPLGLALTALFFLQLPAAAKNREPDPEHMIIRTSGKAGSVPAGSSLLDRTVTTIECRHREGCILNVTSMLNRSTNDDTRMSICTRVDGFCADPDPETLNGDPAISFQSILVGPGLHAVRTELASAGPVAFDYWEINYELYRREKS
jgi:hypothetical protein